jgi:hypothetical protein
MERETIVDNEMATMWYYPDKKIVAHHIKKFIYGETFYKFLLTGTELLRKNKAHKWLSDDRNSPVLRKEDTDWGAVNWFPQTKAAGWKYWAIVKPLQTIGEMSMKRILEEYTKAGVTAQVFSDYDEALAWLESQPD